MKPIFVAILTVSLAVPTRTQAWGMLGHRVVGGVAEYYLTPKARAAIKQLLGNESVAMAANWADFVKSDRNYDYLGAWHYINLPAGMTQQKLFDYLEKDTSTDVYTKLNFIIRQLKAKKSPKSTQALYLKLLIHLVGDLHQPMHAARPEDRGGNAMKLYWFNTTTNLHRLWDEQLVEYQQLSYTEHVAAINFATAAQVKQWQKDPIRQWVYESYRIAGKLYNEVKPEERLSYPYNYHHVETMNQQLLKAGIRLAGVLNSIYSA
jgi:hypothetical protein